MEVMPGRMLCALSLLVAGLHSASQASVNLSEQTPAELVTIPQVKSCSDYNRCSLGGQVRNCYCDDLCHNYNDCCHDMGKKTDVYKPPLNTIECQHHVLANLVTKLSVISSCHMSTDSIDLQHIKRCLSTGGPLVYGGKSGLIYKNHFCSKCHQEKTYTVLPFRIECSENYVPPSPESMLYNLIQNGLLENENWTCYFNYETERAQVHPCRHDIISSCLDDHNESSNAQKCITEPMNTVYQIGSPDSYGKAYRNVYCAQCNGIESTCEQPFERIDRTNFKRGYDSLVNMDNLACFIETDSLEEALNCKNMDKIRKQATLNSALQMLHFNLTANNTQITEARSIKSLLTEIFVIISLISLLIELAFYCLFKKLRNFAGYMVLCLITALFVAQLCFLISVYAEFTLSYHLCAALGVIQHLGFLCSFFWNSVMAFDVTKMLRASLVHQENKKKKITLYSIYAWLIPLVIVSLALAADKLQWRIRPVYGSPTCWINNPIGLLGFFLSPLLLIVAMNVTMYIISTVFLIKSVRQTRMVNPNSKKRLIISVKLISVMGLPWIFAVVSAFRASDIIDYLFIILNASQGFFILASFSFNKSFIQVHVCRSVEKQKSSSAPSVYSAGESRTTQVSGL